MWVRVVNRFLFLFSIVFKNDCFVFGKKQSFLKTTHSPWAFRKWKTIVLENDSFFFKRSFLKIVNEVSLLTIVNETTIFIKTIAFSNDRFSIVIVLKRPFLKNELFEKRSFSKTIVSFSIFCRRFHNETIVFSKKKWKR